jgi:hypothetical protein
VNWLVYWSARHENSKEVFTLKRFSIFLSLLLILVFVPAAAFGIEINIGIPVPAPVIVLPAPPPPVVVTPAPPPQVVVEPAPPAETSAEQQDYSQQQEPAQGEYPAEEYIPEGDPTPPAALTTQNPDLVVVPSGEAQVYMVPNTVGVYFYGGTWYRYHHGVWFTANEYNAPWAVVQTPVVPSFVVGISPTYALYLPPAYYRIHYNDFHSHWRSWDRERRWERESWYKNERRAEVRQARERQARERMQRDRQARNQRIKERDHRAHTGQPGSHKPGQFDQRKTGQKGHIDQKKTGQPGKLDNRKSGQGVQKPQSKQPSKPQPKHDKPHEKEKH